MKNNIPLPNEKKLTVIFRVEPGCLGPEGEKEIVNFCNFAQAKIGPVESDYVNWSIIPRDNKADSEIQFRVKDKILTHEMAGKYLKVLGADIDALETRLFDDITCLIDEYLKH